jgi:hypothetical protein
MATKSSTRRTGGAAQDTVDRIRELNERIVENARKAGDAYLDIYERALESIAGYQEGLARATPVEWIQGVLEAQATFTREIGKAYASTARDAMRN